MNSLQSLYEMWAPWSKYYNDNWDRTLFPKSHEWRVKFNAGPENWTSHWTMSLEWIIGMNVAYLLIVYGCKYMIMRHVNSLKEKLLKDESRSSDLAAMNSVRTFHRLAVSVEAQVVRLQEEAIGGLSQGATCGDTEREERRELSVLEFFSDCCDCENPLLVTQTMTCSSS